MFINSALLANRADTYTEKMKEYGSLSPLLQSKDVVRELTNSCKRDAEIKDHFGFSAY